MNELTSLISVYEHLVYENEESFIDRFCKGHVMEFLGLYFNSDTVLIDYILDCGQRVSDQIDINDFKKWVDKI